MSNLTTIKRNYIIEQSKLLFTSKGIEPILIKDIAKSANIGEATIYRYFKKKDLVIEVAIAIQKEIMRDYFNFDKNKSGIELINDYYNAFYKIFVSHPSYFNFLKELDVFILQNDSLNLDAYEKGINNFGLIYKEIITRGLIDKTIRENLDYETFFYSSTHALLGICEKLALSKAIIKQDEKQNKNEEILLLIDSFINFIKK